MTSDSQNLVGRSRDPCALLGVLGCIVIKDSRFPLLLYTGLTFGCPLLPSGLGGCGSGG